MSMLLQKKHDPIRNNEQALIFKHGGRKQSREWENQKGLQVVVVSNGFSVCFHARFIGSVQAKAANQEQRQNNAFGLI